MQNPRLYYRVFLKSLFAIGVLILLFVFFNSLLVSSGKKSKDQGILIMLDITDMRKGDIRKARLGNKEVAVLFRKKAVLNQNPLTEASKFPPEIFNSASRSQKADYFVYFNHGDSGNCPLFYSVNNFKDVCSSKLFDISGREINDTKHGYKIKIPPHHFNNNKIYFGQWDRE